MNKCNPFVPLAVAAIVVAAFAGTASAEVGKKISVAYGPGGLVSAFPVTINAATVALPASYKSKTNFLKVTTTYSAGCSGSDFMASKVDVGGNEMVDNGYPFEALDEDAVNQIVTKTYYLIPENQGGPAIPPDAMVTVKMTSQFGTGCQVSPVTLTVDALK
jgi:hypothetical protein